MRFRAVLCVLLGMALAAPGARLPGQAAAIVKLSPKLIKCGQWLLSAIASYPIGKLMDQVFDPSTAAQTEKELKELKAGLKGQADQLDHDKALLQSQLDQAGADRTHLQRQLDRLATDQATVLEQLTLASSEILTLHRLVTRTATAEQLARARDEIQRDLESVEATLARHDAKLAAHDRQLKDQARALAEQGRRVDEIERRLDEEDQAAIAAQPPPLPQSLVIEVGGPSNVIRLHEEMCVPSTGRVQVSSDGATLDYCVAPGSQAVVDLAADGTWISMPAALVPRIEIRDHGRPFHRWVYPR